MREIYFLEHVSQSSRKVIVSFNLYWLRWAGCGVGGRKIAGQQELKMSNKLIPKVTLITLNSISQSMKIGVPTIFRKEIFRAAFMCSLHFLTNTHRDC